MASLEFHLTWLLVEWLDVGSHQEEFRRWFMETPIPFRAKVRLYEAVTEGSMMTEQFGDLAAQMREAYNFRNMLAHSFRQVGRLTTSRGTGGAGGTGVARGFGGTTRKAVGLGKSVSKSVGVGVGGASRPGFYGRLRRLAVWSVPSLTGMGACWIATGSGALVWVTENVATRVSIGKQVPNSERIAPWSWNGICELRPCRYSTLTMPRSARTWNRCTKNSRQRRRSKSRTDNSEPIAALAPPRRLNDA